MRGKHILVVSQYFYPESFRINDICQEWVKRGYQITVVTGIPNYPTGKFFDGYGYTKRRRERWKNIDIIRLPLIARGKSAIGMIANYISFVIAGGIWCRISKIEADYAFTFEVSPMTQALIGCWFAKRKKISHYLYVQDLWPENVVTVTGISSPCIIKPINKMVDYIYKNTDEIFATSPSFVESICNRTVKVDSRKVHYWPQYAEDFYIPAAMKAPEISDDAYFKIVFTGNIGTAQGLQILPKVARLLIKEKVRFVMVGDGRYLNDFCDDVKSQHVENMFVMIPRQPAEKIPNFLAACDVAFMSFQDDELWERTIPAKLQSYMACGMPVVAAARGETERIIREAQCGICCEISDVEGLANAIRKMMYTDLSEMRIKSRKYYEEHFDKQRLMDQMERYLE